MITISANKVVYKPYKICFLKDYILFKNHTVNTIIPIHKIDYIDYKDAIVELSLKDGNIKIIKERKIV